MCERVFWLDKIRQLLQCCTTFFAVNWLWSFSDSFTVTQIVTLQQCYQHPKWIRVFVCLLLKENEVDTNKWKLVENTHPLVCEEWLSSHDGHPGHYTCPRWHTSGVENNLNGCTQRKALLLRGRSFITQHQFQSPLCFLLLS